MTLEIVVGQRCECGHWASDHLEECAVGWSGDPGEVECDCLAFVLAYTVVERPHIEGSVTP